jgi:DNA-directed RNA polymerase subunit RPC12/RpoP
MKAAKWYCGNCGTTVIPGEEIEWDENSGCPGCFRIGMDKLEPKPRPKKDTLPEPNN